MKRFSFYFSTLIFLQTLSFPVFASQFEYEKTLIDNHTPQTFNQNIAQIYNYTLETLQDKSNTRFSGLPVDVVLSHLTPATPDQRKKPQ